MIGLHPANRLIDIFLPPTALGARRWKLVALWHRHSVLGGYPVHVAARVGENTRVL